MWHAFRVSNFVAEKHVVINHGVGRDLLNARYYESTRGQFLSQDPSFLSVGDPNQVKSVTGQDQRLFLTDPQQMNSYNYGRDNQFIDVSLKHFVNEDIRKLMHLIHERRPDLSLPKNWI